MKRIIYILCFIFACSITYAKNSDKAERLYKRGLECIEKGDTVKAIKCIQKAADANYAPAQNFLGALYSYGYIVKKNYNQSVFWYKKAVEQGDDLAQCNLGSMYANGCGVERNDSIAVYWFRKAAEQGNANAQYSLGIRYENGDGVKKNDSLAAYWYRQAAERGNAYAQNNLGAMYARGCGIEQNDSLAVYWYRKAAEQGDDLAQYSLARYYHVGRYIEKNDSMAVYWYRQAAERGNAYAQNNLGAMYARGCGIEQNDSLAVYWYRKAAEQGEVTAQNNLGYMYQEGKGVSRDLEKAQYWLNRSKKKSDKENSTIPSSNMVASRDDISVPRNSYQEPPTLLSETTIQSFKERRIALIIGNSDYEERLPNAEKDASTLVKVLSSLNFDVMPCINKELYDMKKMIADFCEKAKGYDVALIYYAGHAVQDEGVNYLIPARPKSVLNAAEMDDRYILLPWVIKSLEKSNVSKNIVILDACRDRPSFVYSTRGAQSGLASVSEPIGFLIAYATQAGMTAKDGTGNSNSPYATALLEELQKPLQNVDHVFINVRERVMELTNDEQKPFYKNNLNERRNNKFYFNPGIKR